VVIGPGREGLDGIGWITFHATVLRNFLEGYQIAARSLGLLVKGPMARKDLVARALRIGERMFLEGAIERSEAVSHPVIDNALSSFCDQGYLVNDRDELALSATFASEEGAATVEARIATYLRKRLDDEPWG
jgi:glycerol-3-phosphate O-acyltransferase